MKKLIFIFLMLWASGAGAEQLGNIIEGSSAMNIQGGWIRYVGLFIAPEAGDADSLHSYTAELGTSTIRMALYYYSGGVATVVDSCAVITTDGIGVWNAAVAYVGYSFAENDTFLVALWGNTDNLIQGYYDGGSLPVDTVFATYVGATYGDPWAVTATLSFTNYWHGSAYITYTPSGAPPGTQAVITLKGTTTLGGTVQWGD